MHAVVLAVALLAGTLGCGGTQAASGRGLRPEIEAFIAEMNQKHGMGKAELRLIMRQARVQHGILRAMSAQSVARPWHRYRSAFINAQRITLGVQFWNRHAALLARAEREYGVPAEIVVATLGVETVYGRHTGAHRVLDALTTLAFDSPDRAAFFRGELEQFLLLVRERVLDPLRMQGSYAGAMGVPQFLPSSVQRYAVDFDGDGERNLWDGSADAIGSVANYYRSFGWQPGEPIAVPAQVEGDAYRALAERGIEPKLDAATLKAAGVTAAEDIGQRTAAVLVLEGETGPQYWLGLNNFYMITRYNRSVNYAMSVFQLAREIRAARDSALQ
ncbi:MAG: lytic murein transglycosylase B [Burkholderiales bacterium]|nr:lytic murein transglycosylase B [Burkholderiales bacterium]